MRIKNNKTVSPPIVFSMISVRNLFPVILVCALILSAGCLQGKESGRPAGPTPPTGHAAMQKALGNVTGGIQSTLFELDSTLSHAAGTLGTAGISGPGADEVLSSVVITHPAIINVITYDQNGTVVAAEPDTAKILLGQNLREYDIVKKTLTTQQPQMSDLFSLAEGGDGVVLAHPVFSPGGQFLGVVSSGISPYALVSPIAGESMENTPYTYMVAQTNGRILYDPDPQEVGKETFNETLFADFPGIIELARHYSGNRTGYDTYSFYSSGFGKVVSKETFWDTVGLHGTEWRVLVISEV